MQKTLKQIIDINAKTAQTFEQNSREVARAAKDSASRFNASVNRGNGSGSSSYTRTTSTTSTSVA